MINAEGQLIGIISERDIISGMSKHADAVLTLQVIGKGDALERLQG